jgi:predicted CXXCH cytochrome family protein
MPVPRADLIVIDTMRQFGNLDRPPVYYPHDAHTITLELVGDSCDRCHMTTKEGEMSLLFNRLANESHDQVMEAYHSDCIDCHVETIDDGREAGPVTCGECHDDSPDYVSTRVSMGMDKSLHYLHVAATNDECGQCHHQYDSVQQQLVYVKGEERSCRDCHRETAQEGVISYATASHKQCLSCHREMGKGRVQCMGCHSSAQQATIKTFENPPRLMRGQPDFILLAANAQERDQSKLRTVPFSHIGHERFTDNCRVCHHESLQACSDCHLLEGNMQADGVTLQQAMHDLQADHSCVGCHNQQKETGECQSCHMLMEKGRLEESTCETCHAGPLPENLEQVAGRYNSLDQFRMSERQRRLSFAEADIPDTVYISSLKGKYQPAWMPHQEIVDTLLMVIENNKVATYFHGSQDVMCQGCHHHSPVGQRPPLCESCHGEPFDRHNLHRPGLYGAFHRQCIGCHSEMDIGEATECTRCHALAMGN